MYLQQRDKIAGFPYRITMVRQNMSRFAHVDIYVEGLRKAGVPE
jgi:adenylate cyclase